MDLPTAIAEAIQRGLITSNQISQQVLSKSRSRMRTVCHNQTAGTNFGLSLVS